MPDVEKCGDTYVIRRDVAGTPAVVVLTFAESPIGLDPKHVTSWEKELRAIEVRFIPSGSYPDTSLFCEAEILQPGDDLVVFERVARSLVVRGMTLHKGDDRRVWLREKTWIELKRNRQVGVTLTFVDSTWVPTIELFEEPGTRLEGR